MKTYKLLGVISLIVMMVIGLTAQGDIITAKQFKELKKSTDNLVIVDASKAKLYKKAHIKGAVNIPYKVLNLDKGVGEVAGLLKPVEDVAKLLGDKGISNTDMIVVYDEGSQKYSSRVYWVLKYLGAKNVKLLHKENKAWRKARIPLTSSPTKLDAKTFEVEINNDVFADIPFIESNKDIVLVDARGKKEFTGTGDKKKTKYSKGHLPGAVNLFFKDVQNEDKSFKSVEDMTKIAEDLGFTKDKTYVVYCKTGIKAAVVYNALKNVLGYPNVKLYDGAYLEWEKKGKPIEK